LRNSTQAVTDDDADSTIDKLGLDSRVADGLCELGITRTLAVQKPIVDAVRSGRDVVVSGPPGSGRTTAVGAALLDRVDLSLGPQMLIISPTKDTAVETQRNIAATGRYKRVKVHASFGGKSGDRAHIKSRQPQIISATLGRALDNMKPGAPIRAEELRTLVVDDCDQMHRKFPEEMVELFRKLPSTCQIVLISGGLGKMTREWASTILRNPIRVDANALSAKHSSVSVSKQQGRLSNANVFAPQSYMPAAPVYSMPIGIH
jgi:superfamily II DNA/RNA helicase